MISVFDMFSIGIGPSSSHTVGPMRAASSFVSMLDETDRLNQVTHIKTELYGSLGQTGKGHGTGKAIILGLHGDTPESIEPSPPPLSSPPPLLPVPPSLPRTPTLPLWYTTRVLARGVNPLLSLLGYYQETSYLFNLIVDKLHTIFV